MSNNGNSTVKWVAIIISIITLFFSIAFSATITKLNKHDELIMEIRECQAEIKSDLKYIRRVLEKQNF
jgi:hypothetical protein